MVEKTTRTEWDMGLMDFQRLNSFLQLTSQLMLSLRNRQVIFENPTIVLMTCDSLKEVYRIIRPILKSDELKGIADGAMEQLREHAERVTRGNLFKKEQGEADLVRCPDKLYYEMDRLYDAFMDLKQAIGAGIPTIDTENVDAALTEMKGIKWKE